MSKYLDKITDYCFLVGMFTSKLKNIPHPITSFIFNTISLSSYLIAYVAWYISSLFYKNYREKNFNWLHYFDFKQQYQLAALLGTIASVMSIIVPTLMIPIAWLYTISNLYWHIGEVYLKKNPSDYDLNYSERRQELNCYRTLLVLLVSAITAMTETLIFFYPFLATIFIPISFTVGSVLTVVALALLLKSTFGTFQADYNTPKNINGSITTMQEMMITKKQSKQNTLQHLESPPEHSVSLRLFSANTINEITEDKNFRATFS